MPPSTGRQEGNSEEDYEEEGRGRSTRRPDDGDNRGRDANDPPQPQPFFGSYPGYPPSLPPSGTAAAQQLAGYFYGAPQQSAQGVESTQQNEGGGDAGYDAAPGAFLQQFDDSFLGGNVPPSNNANRTLQAEATMSRPGNSASPPTSGPFVVQPAPSSFSGTPAGAPMPSMNYQTWSAAGGNAAPDAAAASSWPEGRQYQNLGSYQHAGGGSIPSEQPGPPFNSYAGYRQPDHGEQGFRPGGRDQGRRQSFEDAPDAHQQGPRGQGGPHAAMVGYYPGTGMPSTDATAAAGGAGRGGPMYGQPSWGYAGAGGQGEMYPTQQQRMNQQWSHHMQQPYPGMEAVGGSHHPPMGTDYYGMHGPGPGQPITRIPGKTQGPEGANLFVFHLPNHYTNVDLYNLFSTCGTVISVRIMVDKESGRSRGFGFVSFDNVESGAVAINRLNGYQIGNKRLKVQHKQVKNDRGRGGRSSSPSGQPRGHDEAGMRRRSPGSWPRQRHSGPMGGMGPGGPQMSSSPTPVGDTENDPEGSFDTKPHVDPEADVDAATEPAANEEISAAPVGAEIESRGAPQDTPNLETSGEAAEKTSTDVGEGGNENFDLDCLRSALPQAAPDSDATKESTGHPKEG